jgi:hypothetical protein
MEHDQRARSGEHGGQRREIGEGQGIDQPGCPRAVSDLDQRQALGIVVEAVGFGVDGDLPDLTQAVSQLDEVGLGTDPAENGYARPPR